MYPGYNISVIMKALSVYKHTLIYSDAGSPFNNSMYGALKLLFGHGENVLHSGYGTLDILNYECTAFYLVILLMALYLYLKSLLNNMELIYAAVCCYVLGSTIFATYHTVVFYFIFILFIGEKKIDAQNIRNLTMLVASMFIIIPKNYAYIHRISIEVILNAAVLNLGLFTILYFAFKNLLSRASRRLIQ